MAQRAKRVVKKVAKRSVKGKWSKQRKLDQARKMRAAWRRRRQNGLAATTKKPRQREGQSMAQQTMLADISAMVRERVRQVVREVVKEELR